MSPRAVLPAPTATRAFYLCHKIIFLVFVFCFVFIQFNAVLILGMDSYTTQSRTQCARIVCNVMLSGQLILPYLQAQEKAPWSDPQLGI